MSDDTVKLVPVNEDGDVRCDGCECVFAIIFHLSPDTIDGPEYCPFCGYEIERSGKSHEQQ
jgi:hypothetical protein